MSSKGRKVKFYLFSFLKRDLKASITVFFVALPLCLGISLASGVPVYAGLLSGIVGGLLVGLASGSQVSVSGPAAGLTAICATAIVQLGSMEAFFMTVCMAGLFQLLLGVFKLGGFTHFIPSTVIKGMLAGIGIILISKQIPLLIGYNKADFWTKELFNVITFNHMFSHMTSIYENTSAGAVTISILSFLLLYLWKKYLAKKFSVIPASFLIVVCGSLVAIFFHRYMPFLSLQEGQFVSIPSLTDWQLPAIHPAVIWEQPRMLKIALVICIVASLETLLSMEAVDKLDPYNRITPQNRELVAQGAGNMISGLLGGLPVTAVIVRSSANLEAGARTRLSSIMHGVWLLLSLIAAAALINHIPYCVLAVILVRTGFNLAKPRMIRAVYRLGREQFVPFAVTALSILFTDLLMGVCIGIAFAGYFIIKNTYKAGYTLEVNQRHHISYYHFYMAGNVSFINKKKLKEQLEKIPDHAVVEIDGSHSSYIDYDVLEVINEFKHKANHRKIDLRLIRIPVVETIEAH